jgi:translation initiation factor IF-1
MTTSRMSEATTNEAQISGVITEALPNTLFRVELEGGREVIGYLSGKMRIHRIRVLVGDKVTLVDNPYEGKLRIVKRM